MTFFQGFLASFALRIRTFFSTQWSSAGPLKLAAVGIALAVTGCECAFAMSRGLMLSALHATEMVAADIVLPWAFVLRCVRHGSPLPTPEFEVQIALVSLGMGYYSAAIACFGSGGVP